MQKTTENTNASRRRLEKACEYVSDLWFPVNSELLAKIKMGLQGGVYDIDPETLINTVSSDFSLFMYCFRELLQMLTKEDVDLPPLSNPIDVLRAGGLARLKQILDVDEVRISKHSFSRIDELQSARMEESIISASSAQVLSSSFEVNEEIGYSAALLRQLGHTLIAWNYPTVYKDALNEYSEERSIDVALAERLGFSPTLLSIRLLVNWGMPVEMCEAIFLSDEEPQEFDEIEEVDDLDTFHGILAGSLATLCSIGEALARANNPKLYPTARKDWEYAREAIASKLGNEGLSLIQDAVAENIEHYITFMPEIFTGAFILDPELHLAESERDRITGSNPYLLLCDPPLRARLTHIYLSLVPGEIYEKGVTELVREIVPMSGFTGGCIYTVDPGVQMLVPQTKIATMRLKSAASIDYSLVLSNADSVAVAFRSLEPVIEFHKASDGELLTGISGTIGHSNRVGVFYLEIPHSIFMIDERGTVNQFKAFSRTLTDCLSLR